MWTLTGVAADTDYTLSFRTTPGLELGRARAVAKVEIANGAATHGRRRRRRRHGRRLAATRRRRCPSRATCCTSATSTDADDVDLYGFHSTPLAQVGVRLSHLAGDGDLVVYGPATDRPGNSPSPVADAHRARRRRRRSHAEDLDVSGVGLLARARRRRRRAGARRPHRRRALGGAQHRPRGRRRHRARPAAGQLVQHARRRTCRTCCASARPTRRRTPTCAAYARTGGVDRHDARSHGAAGRPGDRDPRQPAAAGRHVRRRSRGRRDGRASPTFAARPDVNGVVLPVDGDAAVAAAYARVERQPVPSPTRANKVVNEITRTRRRDPQRRAARRRRPPDARQRRGRRRRRHRADGAPRRHHARRQRDRATPTSSTSTVRTSVRSSTSHFLSDDPYGDLDPIQWATRRLYVPELALGRLVEIADADHRPDRRVRRSVGSPRRQPRLRRRLRLHDRRRQHRSRRRSDDVADVGQRRAGDRHRTSHATSRRGRGAELLGDLTGPPAPSVAAIFGHSDHTALRDRRRRRRRLPRRSPRTLPDGARLVFSMGCHSGLAVSDATVGGGAAAARPACRDHRPRRGVRRHAPATATATRSASACRSG